MAGKPKKETTVSQWQECEADWRAGVLSVRELERKHEIPQASIRKRFQDIPRDAGDAKRAIVSAAVSGNPVESMARAAVVAAASVDIEIMSAAARGASTIIRRFADEADEIPMQYALGAVSALQKAVEVYRKARELESPGGGDDALSLLKKISGKSFQPKECE